MEINMSSDVQDGQDTLRQRVSTDEFAALNGVKPGSVISRLSREGSYFGVTPEHLANRRLRWPPVAVMHRDYAPSGAQQSPTPPTGDR